MGLSGSRLVRVSDADGRVHVGVVVGDGLSVLPTDDMLGALLAGELPDAVAHVPLLDLETCAPAAPWRLLAPIVAPETWAAGVTYERSRDARLRESQVADVYERVYDAERPELFLKDSPGPTVRRPPESLRNSSGRSASYTRS